MSANPKEKPPLKKTISGPLRALTKAEIDEKVKSIIPPPNPEIKTFDKEKTLSLLGGLINKSKV
jgi:hypothetical protein